MISSTVSALLRKELRQLGRSRAAMASATLLPILMMVIVPMGQLVSLRAAGPRALRGSLPPGFGEMSDPMLLFTGLLLPLFVTLGGVLVPSVSALYTVVAERERRSLELLMALPARVQDILAAKVLAILILGAMVVLPLFAIDAAALLVLGVGSVGYVLQLLLVVLSALVCGVGIALLVALLARDFRTANNVNGILVGPLILLATGTLIGAPSEVKLPLLAGLLLALGGLSFLAAQRWLNFERYLS